MAHEKFAHSFARFRLEQNNLKIYHGDKQILTPINPSGHDSYTRWRYDDFTTEIIKGRPFTVGEQKSRLLRNYEELIYKTGLMISSRRPTLLRFYGQKVEYYLSMLDTFKRDIGEIPRGHKVELDVQNNRVRLLGPNSLGNWFVYRKSPPAGQGVYGRKDFFYKRLPIFEELLKDSTNFEEVEVPERIPVKEIVVGTCLDSGRLVTIPEENFNPIIFICGKRRMGKTFLHYRFLGNFYHKWNKKCIDMIDIAHESETHSLEWKKPLFNNQLAMINEQTRALPLVYLTPKTNTLKTVPLEDEVGFQITMPFKEWILDYENILKGNTSWEFKLTAVYLRNRLYDDEGNIKKDGLINCSTLKEMNKLVTEGIPKKLTGVKDKIKNVMKDIYTAKILDISTGHKAKWTVEFQDGSKEEHYPWDACLIADLVPVIITSNLRTHEHFYPHYMKYIAEDIYKMQTENDLFLRNKSEIFFFFNELTSIVDGSKGNETVMNETFEKIVRESGPNRIGVIFGTQFIDRVPDLPKSQANYVFSFKQNEKSADYLIKDFDALATWKSDLKRLNIFECIGFPSGSPFHLYDEEGNLEVVMDEPVKMKIFPPLSAHKPPKEV